MQPFIIFVIAVCSMFAFCVLLKLLRVGGRLNSTGGGGGGGDIEDGGGGDIEDGGLGWTPDFGGGGGGGCDFGGGGGGGGGGGTIFFFRPYICLEQLGFNRNEVEESMPIEENGTKIKAVDEDYGTIYRRVS
ncbi:hypothetical protein NC652_016147 [Populus alba x Populus x berolinensis]|nr:hypothetical protein NC652_016147 [Populus alba x Populus x berolinensis]